MYWRSASACCSISVVRRIFALLLISCGGREALPEDAGPDGNADASFLDALLQDAGDAAGWPDSPPSSCADVGKFPGVASCCNGSYCAGFCTNGTCHCATPVGCVWPSVCCGGTSCVSPEVCN